MDWIGLSSVLRPRQHSIGYMGDGFYNGHSRVVVLVSNVSVVSGGVF